MPRCENEIKVNKKSVASEHSSMMEVNSKLFLVIFVLSLIINDAFALKCFQCNSAVHKDCVNDNLVGSKYIVECGSSEDVKYKNMDELPATFCMKLYKKCESELLAVQNLIQVIFHPSDNSHLQVSRSCGHKKQLHDTQGKCQELTRIGSIPSIYCECQSDYCNRSTSTHLKLELVLLIGSIYSLKLLIRFINKFQ